MVSYPGIMWTESRGGMVPSGKIKVHVLKEGLGGGEIVKPAKFIDVCYIIEPF